MNLVSAKTKLEEAGIFHSESYMLTEPSVIGYEKKFKWSWVATQLNTFIVVTDFGDQEINPTVIEKHLTEAFAYSKQHYTGWPRGLQSGVGVISILISSNVTDEAKEYCQQLKSGKKWAGFSIPVVHNSQTNETYQFLSNPMWGRIYYPHFRQLIDNMK